MPLDPVMAAILEATEQSGGIDFESRPIAEVRAEASEGSAVMAAMGREEVGSVDDRTIPGPAGALPVRVYHPDADRPVGICVYLHGGGFTICDLDSHDSICRVLCNRGECIVVSVDYRLAPEHPFPAAVDDAWAALSWVADHGAELGGDPSRLAIAGDSAGGNLAAVAALRARDEGLRGLALQVLIYPGTDRVGDHPSIVENGQGYLLTTEMRAFFERAYLPPGTDRTDWRVSPLLGSHEGAAPAHVVIAEFDPLRDEGAAYAEALRQAGVSTTLDRVDGMIHGFVSYFAVSEVAAAALDRAGAALRVALA